MTSKFSSGKYSIAMCDRCGQKFKLHQLKRQIINLLPTELLVCSECNDQDHPQLQLGRYPVNDPQAVRDPRVDTTYVTAGPDANGNPTDGSRDIQWGWRPVGGAQWTTSPLTPNNLVALAQVGQVTVTTS